MRLSSLHEGVNSIKQVGKKLIGRFGNISIYRVDGEQVRSISSAMEEFNESASHQIIDEIPENEGWVEDTVSADELPFILHGLLVGIQQGDYDAGEKAEKAERAKALPSKHGKAGKPDPGTSVRRLGSLFGIEFHLIDAKVVRDQYKVDFALGGNHGAYDWVPEDEIWLDATIRPNEMPFVALHEFYERFKMLEHKWTYNKAHAAASAIEWKARENKELPQEYVKVMQFVRNALRI